MLDETPLMGPHPCQSALVGYLMSPRQTLGALLAEAGECERAVAIYAADLEIFPRNVWSLAGLQRCLERGAAGDGGGYTLEGVTAALAAAAAQADVKVATSCACALSDWK